MIRFIILPIITCVKAGKISRYPPGYIDMFVSKNIALYSTYIQEDARAVVDRHDSEQSKRAQSEPSSISKLEAPCEAHDIVRVDFKLNRLQPW